MTKNFQAPLNSYNYRYSTVELSDVAPQLRGLNMMKKTVEQEQVLQEIFTEFMICSYEKSNMPLRMPHFVCIITFSWTETSKI